MAHGQEMNPLRRNPFDGRLEYQVPAQNLGVGCEPSFIERFRNEFADGRMKPPRLVKENASVWSDRSLVAEQEVQN